MLSDENALMLGESVEHMMSAMKLLRRYTQRNHDASEQLQPVITALNEWSDVVDEFYGEEARGDGDAE